MLLYRKPSKTVLVFFGTLAGASEVHVQADKAGIADDAVSAVIPQATIYIPFAELVDLEKEIARLTKEEERLTKEIARSNGMLGNPKLYQQSSGSKSQAEKEKTGELSADDGAGSDKIGAAEKINEKRKKTAWKQGNRSESLQLALFAAAGPGMLYSVSG